ncbi:MAG TPA: hypothetical protein VH187_07900 [Scandinavium sp.]|jgi:hypothetical protein|uniref:hypothetical protein n=1 Tax=Scandinavium sp. TaxID=2830653 RepID=UPI002E346C4E|nr:hypothetical protein [Scandinavium sp.]HEX4501067.1 hypothetical protein [Scandinavium sp.]
MKWLLAFLLAIPLHAQIPMGGVTANVTSTIPTLIQMRSSATDAQANVVGGFNGDTASNNYIQVCLANSGQVNNTLVVRTTGTTASTNVSITDDGSSSNTYTLQQHETAGGRTLAVFTASIVNSMRCMKVVFGGGSTDDQVKVYEYKNIATSSPVRASCTGTATSGTAPACSAGITPTANDIVLGFEDVISFGTNPRGGTTFTAQSGYSLIDSDNTGWTASESVISTGSSTTPSITIASATTRANIVGIALKSSSSGASFSGIHVNNVTYFAPEFALSLPITGTTQTIQFPCSGNDLWMMIGQGASGATSNTTSITDSHNTWTALTNLYNSGDGYAIQWWHVTSLPAVCSGTTSFTINFTANPSFLTVQMFDLSNSSGYDSSATCGAGSTPCAINLNTGTQTATVAGAVITPSTSGPGVILSYANQDFNTLTNVSPGNWSSDVPFCPNSSTGCTGSGISTSAFYVGSGFEQDGGTLVDYYSSNSAVSITWTIANTQNQGIGPHFSSAVAVKQ